MFSIVFASATKGRDVIALDVADDFFRHKFQRLSVGVGFAFEELSASAFWTANFWLCENQAFTTTLDEISTLLTTCADLLSANKFG